MTDYDPLKRLGLEEIVEDFGLSCLPQLMTTGDPDTPRLPLVEQGDGSDLEHIQRAICDLEATLNPDQRQQLTTIVAGLCVHMLDTAAIDTLDLEARERRDAQGWVAEGFDAKGLIEDPDGKFDRRAPAAWIQGRAVTFAIRQWRRTPNMRTGEMTALVLNHLTDGLGTKPQSEKTIRKWLKACKPPAASKPGPSKHDDT